MIVCAGKAEIFSFAQPIGIGLIESAFNLSSICSKKPMKYLCFVGTAGSYEGGPQLHSTVYSSACMQLESSSIYAKSYSPIPLQIGLPLDNVPRETFKNFGKVVTNSSNYICSDQELSSRYAECGVEIESMEFFSVLWVAKKLGLEAFGLFYITNSCDQNAHKDYTQNVSAAIKSIENLKECLKPFQA